MSDDKKEEKRGIASFGVGFGIPRAGASGEAPKEASGETVPFRIVAIAPLLPSKDFSTGAERHPELLPVDKLTFDAAMSALAPSLAIEVADPLDPKQPPLRVDLQLKELRAFRPDALVEQVPALRALMEARRVLQMGKDSHAQLSRILPRPTWVDAIEAGGPRGGAGAGAGGGAGPGPVASGATGAKKEPASALDAIFDKIDVGTAAAEPVARGPVPMPVDTEQHTGDVFGNIIARITKDARSDKPPPPKRPTSALGRVDQAFVELLSSVVRHPEVRRLERAWRGVKLLVDRTDHRAGVEVDVVAADAGDVEGVLEQLAKRSGAEAERAPIDLVVVDHVVTATPAETDRLALWGDLAGALRAPLLVEGAPQLVGMDNLAALSSAKKRLTQLDDPRAQLTRALAAKDAARWICIVMNAPALRLPWDPQTSRVKEPPFEEASSDSAEGGAHGSIVFGAAPYVLAILCAASHVRLGWPCMHVGPRNGILENLPVYQASEQAGTYAIPLETLANTEAQNEVARIGVTLLSCAANRDSAILARAPVLYRGPSKAAGDAPAEITLADQLFTARVANAVEQLAAAIPPDTKPSAVIEVARVTFGELFAVGTAPRAPEVNVTVDEKKKTMEIVIRPHGFVGVQLEEIALGAPLSG